MLLLAVVCLCQRIIPHHPATQTQGLRDKSKTLTSTSNFNFFNQPVHGQNLRRIKAILMDDMWLRLTRGASFIGDGRGQRIWLGPNTSNLYIMKMIASLVLYFQETLRTEY